MRISLIVAISENGVIGREGGLPWRLSADLKRFKELTMGHTIIMGRKTWESIGRPLPGRRTIVVSRQADYYPSAEVLVATSLDRAIEAAQASGDDEAFIVGGAEIYNQALSRADRLYLTRVRAQVDGDTLFPPIDWSNWRRTDSNVCGADDKNDYPCEFQVYERVNRHAEGRKTTM
jgi:dihydrofolate reductase